MTKIAMIGAGSTVFMKNLVGDILSEPLLKECEIALMDIDAKRLATSKAVAERIAGAVDARPRISATTDRRNALEDADYVVVMIQVAGYKPGTVIDFEIPKKYGLRQTIADTLGIGGIMRGAAHHPGAAGYARDMEELCPDALSCNTSTRWRSTAGRSSRVTPASRPSASAISVQGTAEELAARHRRADRGDQLPLRRHQPHGLLPEVRAADAGRLDEDLYPRIRQVIEEGRVPDWNRVRYEMFRHFGYFVTESCEHFAEYVPWFIKRDRPDLIEKFNIPLDEYIRRCEGQIAAGTTQEKELTPAPRSRCSAATSMGRRSSSQIETGEPRVINGNVAEPRLDRQSAAGLLRRGAVPGRQERRAADHASARCRRSWPR